ncbi:MAG: hypothetical protein V9G11_08885 [Bifidobacterium adolescentis]
MRGGDRRHRTAAERQVQVDGQIKSGDRGFHGVKGLRQVIGFVNERYLAELERQLDGAERALEDADRRGEADGQRHDSAAGRA